MNRRLDLWRSCASAVVVSLLVAVLALPAQAATILFEERTEQIETTLPDATDLWVRTADLPKVNGFELKPEGACLDDICVPIKQDRDSKIFVTRSSQNWVNVSELADRVQQPYVVDYDKQVWSFGAIPAQRSSFIQSGLAPNFSLPDWQGNQVSLSDFKGKKVMLLSWASW